MATNKVKRKKSHYFENHSIFVGTNVIPFGQAKAERRNDPKAEELRMAFILFERSKRKYLELAKEHYQRDLKAHKEQVENFIDKLQREWVKKKWNGENHYPVYGSSPVIKKTSRKIVCG